MGGVIYFSESFAQESVQSAKSPGTVMMKVEGGYRFISGYGIPRHAASAPEALGIKAEPYAFRVSSKPEAKQRAADSERGAFFGVSVDGVPFGRELAGFWQNNQEWPHDGKSHDKNGGVVLEDGRYIYTAIPENLVNKDLSHVGYAADGFPIFVSKANKFKSGYRLKEGQRPEGALGPGGIYDGTYITDYHYVKGSGALDACNGMMVKKKYYIYILTEEFPRIPLCWSGTPDESFLKFVGVEISAKNDQNSGRTTGCRKRAGC